MKIDLALFAERAETNKAGLLHVFGGCLDVLSTAGFPALSQFALVSRFTGEPSEHGSKHAVSLAITKPNGEKIAAGPPSEISLGKDNPPVPELPPGMILIMQLAVEFTEAGMYTFHLEVDGEEVKSLRMYVKPIPQSSAQT